MAAGSWRWLFNLSNTWCWHEILRENRCNWHCLYKSQHPSLSPQQLADVYILNTASNNATLAPKPRQQAGIYCRLSSWWDNGGMLGMIHSEFHGLYACMPRGLDCFMYYSWLNILVSIVLNHTTLFKQRSVQGVRISEAWKPSAHNLETDIKFHVCVATEV